MKSTRAFCREVKPAIACNTRPLNGFANLQFRAGSLQAAIPDSFDPLAWTSRNSPPPTNTLYSLSRGLAFRTWMSVSISGYRARTFG